MLKDHNHDLVKQLSELSSSLWRINTYKKNAKESKCKHCEKLWGEVKSRLEVASDMLVEEITRHVREGKFE